ncbi:hypothetical protein POTOM_044588 [Populus tomentosa]|uniref:RING-CH-type domain-containing protein n=1 Tax=Populus tomentosa TaxID=118781 RepID=A0A8X8CGE6_POPTO|nr:hypothetical protein POTOM_044588 [Populus tomentosa]
MVDDFMVCVDRIIVASTCFESVHNGERDRNRSDGVGIGIGATGKDGNVSESVVSVKGNEEGSSCSLKKVEMVECRICQEEAEVLAMEVPCACNGTLKCHLQFAHRKCIQRWCNKKGDITCEICNQVFSPNYSLPPARINPDVMAIDIRQAWGHHIDLHDSHLLALEHQLLQSEYDDYAVANTSSIACLRSVALILLIILLLRQALMVTKDSGMVEESSTFFSVFSGFASSICWFSFAMLCDGSLLVHCAKPKEKTCISFDHSLCWVFAIILFDVLNLFVVFSCTGIRDTSLIADGTRKMENGTGNRSPRISEWKVMGRLAREEDDPRTDSSILLHSEGSYKGSTV